ncbi:MAG: hypothetical protein ACTHNA_11795 [Sphingopyxis terrae]|uniref:hypothetical protein n=1 Tax=Sphingopyxis terrae TaxID=33052 RepID=UPI003F7D4E73
MTHVSEYLTATKQFVGDGEYWLFLPMAGAIELEKRLGIDDREGRRQPKSLCMIYGQLAGSFFEHEGKLKLLDGGHIHPGELNEILRAGLIGGNCGPDLGEGTAVGPQREAMPDKAAESDASSERLSRQLGEALAGGKAHG